MRTWWSRVIDLESRVISRILPKNYHLARASYHRRLYRRDLQHKEPPLLIYQMGKVGSKTVRNSLQALELDRTIFHIHYLSLDRIRELEAERKRYLGTQQEHLLRHIWQYQYVRKQMASNSNGKRWEIITLTREPISRNIATFFENLEVTPITVDRQYRIKSDYYDFDIVLDIEDMDKLVKLFFERLNHDSPLTFFDQELKCVFGVDVFASEFPTSKGYKIYKDKQADVLLIRLHDLNKCARHAFEEFLGLKDFTLLNTNVGGAKEYASLYQRFKNSIVLPETYVEKMYTSRYMRHFYSEKEIAKFRASWKISKN